MKNYYYSDDNKKAVGPHSLEHLTELLEKGEIKKSTLIIAEGEKEWISYSQLMDHIHHSKSTAYVASKFDHVYEKAANLNFKDFMIGMIMILASSFTLPWTLICGAFANVSEWGKNKTLPIAFSDVPVLTYLTVVLRPLWIISTFLMGIIFATSSLFWNFNNNFFGISYRYEISDRILHFMGYLLGTYLSIFVVGLVFDIISLITGMANNVKEINRKTRSLE